MCASVGDAVWTRLGVESDAYRGVVMWAPSFRGAAPVVNARGIRTGLLASSQLLETLSRLLSQQQYLLVIKRHPYEQGPAISGFANIVEVPQTRMDREQVSLYEMLAATDLLITDVSSVWIDFLALDRPILIYVPDKDEFAKERGFVLEPYEEWSPSPLLLDETSLVQSLAVALQPMDEHAPRRRRIARLLLPSITADGASRRLVERMNAVAAPSQRV
jgi:CDP-glycerol glycerophosphotransferase (TagB/SpsB family)